MQEERVSQLMARQASLWQLALTTVRCALARLLHQSERFRGIVRGQPSVRTKVGGILQADVILRSGKGREPPAPPAVRCAPNSAIILEYPFLMLFYTRGDADGSSSRITGQLDAGRIARS